MFIYPCSLKESLAPFNCGGALFLRVSPFPGPRSLAGRGGAAVRRGGRAAGGSREPRAGPGLAAPGRRWESGESGESFPAGSRGNRSASAAHTACLPKCLWDGGRFSLSLLPCWPKEEVNKKGRERADASCSSQIPVWVVSSQRG